MTVPEPMRPPNPRPAGPCPSDEELGAFIEGNISATERARMIAHVARCERCYEVVAGVLAFEQAEGEVGEESPHGEADDDEVERPKAAVVVFPSGDRAPSAPRPMRWVLPLAASLVLGATGGWLLYRMVLSPRADTAAALAAELRPPTRPIPAHLWASRAPEVYRGPEEKEPGLGALSASYVLLGAYWADLRLSSAAGEVTIAQQASRRVLERGDWLGVPPAVIDGLTRVAAAGGAAPEPNELDALERVLLRDLDPAARPYYGLGACLQTLRFAAETGQVGALAARSPVLRCVGHHAAELGVLAGGAEDGEGIGEKFAAVERALRSNPPDATRLSLELSAILRELEARVTAQADGLG